MIIPIQIFFLNKSSFLFYISSSYKVHIQKDPSHFDCDCGFTCKCIIIMEVWCALNAISRCLYGNAKRHPTPEVHPCITNISHALLASFLLQCFCVSLYTFPVQQCGVLVTHINACGLLDSAELKDFAKALVDNRLGALAVVPGAPGGRSAVVELTIHMASVLLCTNQGILVPLQNLALSTVNMQVSALAIFSLVNLANPCASKKLFKW